MKKFLLSFIALCMFACGVENGQQGEDGKDGENGKPAVCQVIEKDGKKILSCKNADGSVVEAEVPAGQDGQDGEPGTPGQDGKPAVQTSLACKYFWANEGSADAGQDVSFNVIFLNDGSALASLHTQYKAPSTFEFVQTTTAYWSKASGVAEKALVENTTWKVELINKSSAKVFRKGINQERTVQCSQG